MTDSADDLDALFEEMASQRQETETSPSAGRTLLQQRQTIR
jgi:hypothetical protein